MNFVSVFESKSLCFGTRQMKPVTIAGKVEQSFYLDDKNGIDFSWVEKRNNLFYFDGVENELCDVRNAQCFSNRMFGFLLWKLFCFN